MKNTKKIAIVLCALTLLCACGGGSSGGTSSPPDTNPDNNPDNDSEIVWGDNWGTLKWSSVPAAAQ